MTINVNIQPVGGAPKWPIPINTKIYKAIIKQQTTDAPTATILQNTVGNIIWTRSSIGKYFGTLTGAFTPGKTIVKPGGPTQYAMIGSFSATPFDYGYNITNVNIDSGNPDPDKIMITVYNATGAFAELSTAFGFGDGGILVDLEIKS